MFAKLRTAKYLKTPTSAGSSSVQLAGKVQRFARMQHYSLHGRESRKGPEVRYADRRVLEIKYRMESVILYIQLV
ncbi:TPA: phage virion morphogenesis protein [Enterobacter cloacae]|nr:phage virion morphogenesis protein [Enterobacter pasteurii]